MKYIIDKEYEVDKRKKYNKECQIKWCDLMEEKGRQEWEAKKDEINH